MSEYIFVSAEKRYIRHYLAPNGNIISYCKPRVNRVRFDHLRDPLTIPQRHKNEEGWEEFFYEGFDQEGLFAYGEDSDGEKEVSGDSDRPE